jgi:hypothetical protein
MARSRHFAWQIERRPKAACQETSLRRVQSIQSSSASLVSAHGVLSYSCGLAGAMIYQRAGGGWPAEFSFWTAQPSCRPKQRVAMHGEFLPRKH